MLGKMQPSTSFRKSKQLLEIKCFRLRYLPSPASLFPDLPSKKINLPLLSQNLVLPAQVSGQQSTYLHSSRSSCNDSTGFLMVCIVYHSLMDNAPIFRNGSWFHAFGTGSMLQDVVSKQPCDMPWLDLRVDRFMPSLLASLLFGIVTLFNDGDSAVLI